MRTQTFFHLFILLILGPHHIPYEILVPQLGIEPLPAAVEVLATGWLGKFLHSFFQNILPHCGLSQNIEYSSLGYPAAVVVVLSVSRVRLL